MPNEVEHISASIALHALGVPWGARLVSAAVNEAGDALTLHFDVGVPSPFPPASVSEDLFMPATPQLVAAIVRDELGNPVTPLPTQVVGIRDEPPVADNLPSPVPAQVTRSRGRGRRSRS